MKISNWYITLLLSVVFLQQGNAQKFCFVDSKYILSEIPEYNISLDQVDEFSIQWQTDIETKQADLDQLFASYQAEQALFTEDLRQEKEDEIIRKEREVKELKRKYFGPDGLLFQKQKELLKPIQERVYKAIDEYADRYNYAIVFDRSSDLLMLYTDEKYNKSNEILSILGY